MPTNRIALRGGWCQKSELFFPSRIDLRLRLFAPLADADSGHTLFWHRHREKQGLPGQGKHLE